MRGNSIRLFDFVILDERVRQQPLAHALDLGACLIGIRRLELEIDDAAHPCLADREAELAERALDSLPLRVEDPLLRPDENGGPHRSTTAGSAR